MSTSNDAAALVDGSAKPLSDGSANTSNNALSVTSADIPGAPTSNPDPSMKAFMEYVMTTLAEMKDKMGVLTENIYVLKANIEDIKKNNLTKILLLLS